MSMETELETISLIVIAVLAVFHYDPSCKDNRRYQFYNGCLLISGAGIVLNILSCFTIDGTFAVPMWLNVLINSCSFALITATFSLLAVYAFFLLHEYNPDRKVCRRAIMVVVVFAVILLLLVIINLWTGCYFYFDGTTYVRGPLNRLGYGALMIELIMLCVCYFKNRRIASPGVHQLMRAMPPLLILLVIVQLLLPNVLLTGTLTATVNLIFYCCFQNNRIGRDSLTEILSRSSFFRNLETKKKKGVSQHIILLNLREFSKVNRKCGMKQGDSILYMVARYLDDLDENYQAYRFGNTRFMLLGDFRSEQKAKELAVRIQKRFTKSWTVQGTECVLDAQIVHMKLDDEKLDANIFIDQLDYMLTYSRNNGKNNIVFFDHRLKKMFARNKYVLDEMKYALDNETFQIHFQPVYCCKKEQFVSAEVLLRLVARDGQSISPSEFIPLAEEKGLTDEISWLVLKKVCIFLSEHPDLPLESVSINMSIQQMADRYICKRIENYRKEYGVPSEKLRIEITERVIAENPSLVAYVMKHLCSQGVGFYLDDFGVGYSNLAGMMSLPFETVKLDRSIMHGIEHEEKEYRTVDLLVQMLHNAGFLVVAEGLETKEQVECAKKLQVDRIQGFYYARPMDGETLLTFIQEQNGIE